VNPRQWEPLQQGVPHARIVRWKRAQHFVMLDTSQDFMEKLKEFLDDSDPVKNDVK